MTDVALFVDGVPVERSQADTGHRSSRPGDLLEILSRPSALIGPIRPDTVRYEGLRAPGGPPAIDEHTTVLCPLTGAAW